MATETTKSDEGSPVRTGIEALDDILGGGLTPNRVYLIEGDPGSGKTTLALQFLMEGARRGEKVLYVTLSETKVELAGVAESPRLVPRRHRHPRARRHVGASSSPRISTRCSSPPRSS